MLTILIRTSYRPVLFKRLLDSIYAQTHQDFKIIVSYDNDLALSYIPDNIQKIKVFPDKSLAFPYDAYVNELKALVTEGFFIVIDDDEFLYDCNAFRSLQRHLKGSGGIVVQMNRSGRLKPSNEFIRDGRILMGKIGMPCLVLHHSLKSLVDLDASVGASDYHWIKSISKKIRLKFIPLAIAYCDRRSNGVMES